MTLRGTAVDGYLKVVKWPLDGALGLLGSNGGSSAAKVSLDRADATVRSVAALVLNDDALREDANRRRAAADERARALGLRREAGQHAEVADERLAEQEAQSEKQRRQAARRSEAQRNRAEKARKTRAERAAKTGQERKAATEKAAARAQEAIDDRERRAQLTALEEKSVALDEEERALQAKDEALRLGEAAARAKAARKNGS